MDLYEQIQKFIAELDASVRQLRTSGTDLAQAEMDYKICLSQKALELKESNKTPVTLISLIIYGILEVAKLRFKRDVKQVIYQANQESINSTKLKLRLLEAQLNREWGNTK